MRLLLVRLSAFGDIVHAFPLATGLRRAYPDAKIGWVVEAPLAPLVELCPDVDQTVVVDTKYLRQNPLFGVLLGSGRSPSLIGGLANLQMFKPDIVLDCQGNTKSGLAAWLSGGNRRIGFSAEHAAESANGWFLNEKVHGPFDGPHVILQNLGLLRALGQSAGKEDVVFNITIPESALGPANEVARQAGHDGPPLVMLHPGAAWSSKRMPVEKWIALAKALVEENAYRPVLAWAPGEQAVVNRFRQELGEKVLIPPRTSFVELAGLISRCAGYIGPDTGSMHFAAAIGVPCGALFGPTSPERNGPWGEGHGTLHIVPENGVKHQREWRNPEAYWAKFTHEQLLDLALGIKGRVSAHWQTLNEIFLAAGPAEDTAPTEEAPKETPPTTEQPAEAAPPVEESPLVAETPADPEAKEEAVETAPEEAPASDPTPEPPLAVPAAQGALPDPEQLTPDTAPEAPAEPEPAIEETPPAEEPSPPYTEIDPALVSELAGLYGVLPKYSDIWGNRHETSLETKVRILAAMGIEITDKAAQQRSLERTLRLRWTRRLEPVQVVRASEHPLTIPMRFPVEAVSEEHAWVIEQEDRLKYRGGFRPQDLPLVATETIDGREHQLRHFNWDGHLALGYHQFRLSGARPGIGAGASMQLIVTPDTCYEPERLGWGKKAWGLEVQLYAVRSKRNWGIGDFTDLARLARITGERGAGLLGLNPIHALFPHNPKACSPYSPSSRQYANPLYLDIEAIPEFQESSEARALLAVKETQDRLEELRKADLVDYEGVSALKHEFLELLYGVFVSRHLESRSQRGEEFLAYCQDQGLALELHTTYEALQGALHAEDESQWGWPVWPEAYRTPASPAVSNWAEENRRRVSFFAYLQWEAERQLEAAARACMESEMAVGMYLDIAVGNDQAGSDVWMHQAVHALGMSVGAPPDQLSPDGQNWGFPPLGPVQMKEMGYLPFIQMVQSNMRHAGAIRMDHILGLYRLFWVPDGKSAKEGAYVLYPMNDLLGILALESHRNQCMVIGEDMGTVPPELRTGMNERGVYGIKVLYFEKRDDGSFKRPREYFWREALSVANHDLPTLAGFVSGHDIKVSRAIGRIPTDEAANKAQEERLAELRALLQALASEDLLPGGLSADAPPRELTPRLALAIQTYAARTESKLQLVQLEDIMGQEDQVNLPGTTDEHPNWRRKLPKTLDDLESDKDFGNLVENLSEERPR